MVSGLLSIDLVILLCWQIFDPLQRILETFPLEDPVSTTDDIKIRPELEHCESERNSMWLGKYLNIYFKFVLINRPLTFCRTCLWR